MATAKRSIQFVALTGLSFATMKSRLSSYLNDFSNGLITNHKATITSEFDAFQTFYESGNCLSVKLTVDDQGVNSVWDWEEITDPTTLPDDE